MKTLADCKLYGILDLGYVPLTDVESVARLMLRPGGVDILQLRAKKLSPDVIETLGRRIHALSSQAGIPLIINDHPEIAGKLCTEGAHIGQDDGPLAEARKKAHSSCWIGRSTHSLDQAVAAMEEGADYIGFGPLFATPTKPDYTAIGLEKIRDLHERITLPIFCIGGIKRGNLPAIVAAGAKRVVIVSGILQAENIPQYMEDCRNLLKD
ncbi:MAG: thiamine phosphate synthase [Chthoniobacterales bacterium]